MGRIVNGWGRKSKSLNGYSPQIVRKVDEWDVVKVHKLTPINVHLEFD